MGTNKPKSFRVYEGMTLNIKYGDTIHRCTVTSAGGPCITCNGPTANIKPDFNGWNMICLNESALVQSQAQYELSMQKLREPSKLDDEIGPRIGVITKITVNITPGE